MFRFATMPSPRTVEEDAADCDRLSFRSYSSCRGISLCYRRNALSGGGGANMDVDLAADRAKGLVDLLDLGIMTKTEKPVDRFALPSEATLQIGAG